jgi:hypothetical protein
VVLAYMVPIAEVVKEIYRWLYYILIYN